MSFSSVGRLVSIALLATLVFSASCKHKHKKKVLAVDEGSSDIRPVGVNPHDFNCETVAPVDMVGGAVGQKVKLVDAQFEPPAGLAKPCNYVGEFIPDAGTAVWSFDIDCRERALEDADQLMVKYATGDASTPMAIGISGLDHNNAALLFIDDDSPCYVRVLGPGQENRSAIARIVAEKLNEETAPMSTIYQSSSGN